MRALCFRRQGVVYPTWARLHREGLKMSRLLSGALLLAIVGIMACAGATPTPDPTATPPPTPAPAPTATPPPTATPAPTATLTPRATATPVPTAAAQQQVSAGEGIAPLPVNDLQMLMLELSQPELGCISGSSSPQALLAALQAPDTASPEDVAELSLCLRDGTLLRLFLTGIMGTGRAAKWRNLGVRSRRIRRN